MASQSEVPFTPALQAGSSSTWRQCSRCPIETVWSLFCSQAPAPCTLASLELRCLLCLWPVAGSPLCPARLLGDRSRPQRLTCLLLACVCMVKPLMDSPCLQGAPPGGGKRALAGRGGPLLLFPVRTGLKRSTTRNRSFSQTHSKRSAQATPQTAEPETAAPSCCQADVRRARGHVLTCGLPVCVL